MIDVVNDVAGGDFYYTAVHVNGGGVFSCGGVAFGVKGVAVLSNVPFAFTQRFEVVGVNDGKFALCQGYVAERIAVAEAAIQKKNKDQSLFQPAWYFERNANFPASWEKSEFSIMKIVRRENLQSPSIIRATCVFDAKFSKFSKNRIELSACVERNKKKFENFDFCS